MIKLCIFDMGGVMIRDFHIAPRLFLFLGFTQGSFAEIDPLLGEAMAAHGRGEITEDEFWRKYTEISGRAIPPHEGSLLGKFFTPRMDEPTVAVVRELKKRGMRVVAGTNVIDAHYEAHQRLKQYDIFDKVYASHLMGIAKPDPAFYTHILEAEGLGPKEAFFTDDVKENADAAAKLGLAAFTYTDAATLRSHLAAADIS
ncbi:hypothetical protein FACS1894110_05650 [Spirochaetia bacterium]|nr:hypothetical protein FACS1894110_05650 [Spirochaetia bacterium]